MFRSHDGIPEGNTPICVSKSPHHPATCSTTRHCNAHRNYVCAAWPKNGRYMGYCTIALKQFYCKENAACRRGEKCAASGRPEHGVCKPESDPTREYCKSTKDCQWYALETCNDEGECVKRYDK